MEWLNPAGAWAFFGVPAGDRAVFAQKEGPAHTGAEPGFMEENRRTHPSEPAVSTASEPAAAVAAAGNGRAAGAGADASGHRGRPQGRMPVCFRPVRQHAGGGRRGPVPTGGREASGPCFAGGHARRGCGHGACGGSVVFAAGVAQHGSCPGCARHPGAESGQRRRRPVRRDVAGHGHAARGARHGDLRIHRQRRADSAGSEPARGGRRRAQCEPDGHEPAAGGKYGLRAPCQPGRRMRRWRWNATRTARCATCAPFRWPTGRAGACF